MGILVALEAVPGYNTLSLQIYIANQLYFTFLIS